MKKTFSQWLEYIQKIHSSSIDLGLQRIVPIAEKLDLIDFKCPVITVAGTNGKGSCVKFLESIYHAQGYKVGAYTSPQLFRFNERVCVNLREIEDQPFIDAFEKVESVRKQQSLSFFEFTTLAALMIFKDHPLDVLVLEIGLGGRLDAVNTVEPDVSVIASIGIDHTHWLGPDRNSIAREKAGIMRKGKPAVCGDPDPPRSLMEYADQVKAELFLITRDFDYEINGQKWHWSNSHKSYQNLPPPQLKCQNAATSLQVIELLQQDLPVREASIHQGLQEATLMGRFERIHEPVPIIFDVAHNAHATTWLAEQLRSAPFEGKTLAVFSMLADKDIAAALEPMREMVDAWYIAPLQTDRAASLEHLCINLETVGIKNWYNFPTVYDAYHQAVKACQGKQAHRVVVFGSFHTVAEARKT